MHSAEKISVPEPISTNEALNQAKLLSSASTSTGDVLRAPTVVPLSLCAVLMDGTEQA